MIRPIRGMSHPFQLRECLKKLKKKMYRGSIGVDQSVMKKYYHGCQNIELQKLIDYHTGLKSQTITISKICSKIEYGLLLTRTTNVVRNAGCARSRYTLKLSLKFFFIT